jgi:hypothetical protein
MDASGAQLNIKIHIKKKLHIYICASDDRSQKFEIRLIIIIIKKYIKLHHISDIVFSACVLTHCFPKSEAPSFHISPIIIHNREGHINLQTSNLIQKVVHRYH